MRFSSVHEIFQERTLEWVAISFSRGYSQPRDRNQGSCTAGRFFTDWATRETLRGECNYPGVVARSWTGLSDFTFNFHFHALEKEMATHSSVLAWRIPGTGEPGGLPSMRSPRVRHDWGDLAAAAAVSGLVPSPLLWERGACNKGAPSTPREPKKKKKKRPVILHKVDSERSSQVRSAGTCLQPPWKLQAGRPSASRHLRVSRWTGVGRGGWSRGGWPLSAAGHRRRPQPDKPRPFLDSPAWRPSGPRQRPKAARPRSLERGAPTTAGQRRTSGGSRGRASALGRTCRATAPVTLAFGLPLGRPRLLALGAAHGARGPVGTRGRATPSGGRAPPAGRRRKDLFQDVVFCLL